MKQVQGGVGRRKNGSADHLPSLERAEWIKFTILEPTVTFLSRI